MGCFCIEAARRIFRGDSGQECIAQSLRAWYGVLAVAPLFNESGSPRGSVYVESFNGRLWDELSNAGDAAQYSPLT